MKPLLPYLLVVLQVALTFAGTLSAQPADPTEPTVNLDDAIERARQIARKISSTSGVPGMSFAISYNGKIVWEEGFGLADYESATPATPVTKYRVGSVAKSFTAAAVGSLVDDGRLDLDAEVQEFVPDFPRKRWPITTRQVAGHIAGIRHYRDNEFLSNTWYPSVDSGLTIFEFDTLLFEPGTDFHYSSYGFNLVSAIVERAAGVEFLAYMDDAVFKPAGMTNTLADVNHDLIPLRSGFYEQRDGKWYNAPHVDNSYKWAGGGFLSTAGDLVRFGMAMLGGSIVDPATIDELWTRQVLANGDSTGYGIGFSIGRDHRGRRTVGHGGGSVGGNAELLIYPDFDLVLAAAANADAPVHYNELMAMAESFLSGGGDIVHGVPESYLGTWDCLVTTNDGDEERTLAFPPELTRFFRQGLLPGLEVPGYVVIPDERPAEFLDAWSERDDFHLIAMTSSGWVRHIRLAPDESGDDTLAGKWNHLPLHCTRSGE